MITVSNDNQNRVDAAVDKELTKCFNLINQAILSLHDTGDTESDDLDNAMTHLRCAYDMIAIYRSRKA